MKRKTLGRVGEGRTPEERIKRGTASLLRITKPENLHHLGGTENCPMEEKGIAKKNDRGRLSQQNTKKESKQLRTSGVLLINLPTKGGQPGGESRDPDSKTQGTTVLLENVGRPLMLGIGEKKWGGVLTGAKTEVRGRSPLARAGTSSNA